MKFCVLKGLAGILVTLAGCGFDSFQTGITTREVRGEYNRYKIDRFIPLYRVQANKMFDNKTEGYARFDYNKGEIAAEHPAFWGDVNGHIESFGIGVNYFPFSDCWGFEFGGEFFHADFYMNGGLGRLKIKTPDEIFGWGVNAGIFAEIPINKKVSLFGSAGYNFTDNWTARAWSDFDGWSGFAGVRINLND